MILSRGGQPGGAFFKHISRLGNGRFWYTLIALIAVTEGVPALPLPGQTLLTAGACLGGTLGALGLWLL